MAPPRVSILAIVLGLLAVMPARAQREAASEHDGILVTRNDQDGTTTVLIPTHDGLLEWKDVARGLALAANLDADAAAREFDDRVFDLGRRSTRWTVRTLSAALPDVHLRVVDHPVCHEPALSIRLDRSDARAKIRNAKRLLREHLAGDGAVYGLKLDDRWDRSAADRPLVVLLHGFSSNPQSLDGLHTEIRQRGWPCATFAYPNDGPLEASGVSLANELRQFAERYPQRRVILVAHSMGGLVARAAIEDPQLDPQNVSKLIMVCTPNHGTRWAELPVGVDWWEHFRGPQAELPAAFRDSISDGLNEARADLKPQSEFLRELNARQRNPNVRYSLILGTAAPFTPEEIVEARHRITRSLSDHWWQQLFLPRVDRFFDGFDELVAGKGDGFVSVARGRLDGVTDTVLLPLTHGAATGAIEQPGQRELCDLLIQRLNGAGP